MANKLLTRLAQTYSLALIEFPHLRAVTMAQWLLESGRATSDLATHHYNFGGLKWRPEMSSFAAPVEYEANDGVDIYCRFESLEKYIAGYWRFLERAPYLGWRNHNSTAEKFIKFIGPIYCPPNRNYAADVLKLVPEAEKLLAGGPAPVEAMEAVTSLGAIVIDPGHGGTTTVGGSSPNNAKSVSGVLEKNLALDFCKLLRVELASQAVAAGESVDIHLTRETDVNVGIVARAKLAATKNAKLFLSWHFNGSTNARARGPETFFRSRFNGNPEEAADKAFAKRVHKGLFDGIKAIDPTVTDRGVKPDEQSGPKSLGTLKHVMLGNATRPKKTRAAYIEAEFITNATVEKVLVSGPNAAANRKKVVASIAKALLEQLRAMA